jgi:hypothetical protein
VVVIWPPLAKVRDSGSIGLKVTPIFDFHDGGCRHLGFSNIVLLTTRVVVMHLQLNSVRAGQSVWKL